MGKIDYKAIYDYNRRKWEGLTDEPEKYEALLAGHYSDSNHFVYELLQNAEDAFEVNENGVFDPETCAYASKVVIECYPDKLIFYHNGKPFDKEDVKGVSSMLMGTKDRNDAQTIGRFGMGFKSVFKYTYQPEIYSDNEAFKITKYLLPVEIADGWNFETEKKNIICRMGNGSTFMPFWDEKHLTKIVIPFKKYGKGGELVSVDSDDVLKKLYELDEKILLFLTHIQNIYWINKRNSNYAKITVKQDSKDENIVTCRIEGTNYDGKENISRYLKFKKIFKHPDMDNAEVSVAYKLNSRADNINEVEDSPVCVYFPTRDETDLPFLIHGSFETAVSREKLMSPSSFNDDLFEELCTLIAESMKELAKRKLITQAFLRRSILTAFEDEEENETIPGLKEKITKIISEYGLLPDKNGSYRKPADMCLPVPFRIGDFADKAPFNKAIGRRLFVAFNNERETKFSEYFNWLVDDLEIPVYSLCDLAKDLAKLEYDSLKTSKLQNNLGEFYEFLSDNRESVYETGLSYSRSGPYESRLRRDLREAWRLLRQAPIILNRQNYLVPAEKNDKPNVYLGSSSEYKSVMLSALVNKKIAEDYAKVMSDGFHIQQFDNFQYIKEKVIKKYVDIKDGVEFDNAENYLEEYLEDLQQVLNLVEETGKVSEVKDLLEDAWFIKVKTEDGEDIFAYPGQCYVPISEEGIDLNVYYAKIPKEGLEEDELADPDNWYDFDLYALDKEFYDKNGIAISKLAKLGLITTPVEDGERSMNGVGDHYWIALGEYCPDITINGLTDNLSYIEEYYEQDLAKKKSAEILKLLLTISGKLRGRKRKRQRNPYEGELEEVFDLTYYIKPKKWLFGKDMKVYSPESMSKHDLHPSLYGNITANKSAYDILGFIEKDIDEAEETLQRASKLNDEEKKKLLNSLASQLGLKVSYKSDDDDWDDESKGEQVFNPNSWQDDEFPVNRIHNIEYLTKHVEEQFYCADPVTYRPVLRKIRTSKNTKADRSYAIGMYTNSSNIKICQMCKKPIVFIEVDQIANFGIEMPQLNLCLCRECSAKYKDIRDKNKEEFKNLITKTLLSFDIEDYSEDFSIEFDDDTFLHFTQTHIAEIQVILRLLAEYGTPSENIDDDEDNVIGGPLMHPIRKKPDVDRKHPEPSEELKETSRNIDEDISYNKEIAKAGKFISYKKKFANDEIYDNVLQPDKFPLHKALEGHSVGDIITFQGKKYEIVGL